jgi:hypothetical protein
VPTGDAWYPPAAEYWVEASDADAYPYRYGDLFRTPDVSTCKTTKGAPWRAVQILHPSCELGAKATETTEVLVARVYRVNEYGAKSRGPIRTGFIESGGQISSLTFVGASEYR